MIKQWANERNLHTADPAKQILKIGEEYGELCEFITKDKHISVAKDAIGDLYVTLVVLSMQLNLDIEKCIEEALEIIQDRKGVIKNGVFIKESDL